MRNSLAVLTALALVAPPACKSDSAPETAPASAEATQEEVFDEPVLGPDSLKAVQLAMGYGTSCALMDNGTVRCWGGNSFGERGTPSSDDDVASPVAVPEIDDGLWIVTGGTASGEWGSTTCVGRKDETVWCWGAGNFFPSTPLGDEPTLIPQLRGALHVSIGGNILYAVMADRTVTEWRQIPSDLERDAQTQVDIAVQLQRATVPELRNVVAIAAPNSRACALVDRGAVMCRNDPDKTSFDLVTDVGEGFVALTTTSTFNEVCASRANQDVVCFDSFTPKGNDRRGSLNGTIGFAGVDHRCRVKNDGTVWCTDSSNLYGEQGNGVFGPSKEFETRVRGLRDVVSIAAGQFASCAILRSGAAKCWGCNGSGQLGDGTLMDHASPVNVLYLNDTKLPAALDGSAAVQQSTKAMNWTDMPKGCRWGDLAMRIESSPDRALAVASSYAWFDPESRDSLFVVVANYQLDSRELRKRPRANQRRVKMTFHVPKTPAAQADGSPSNGTLVGQYPAQDSDSRIFQTWFEGRLGEPLLHSVQLRNQRTEEATITHLDDKWVCGEFKAKSGENYVAGPFAARIIGRSE